MKLSTWAHQAGVPPRTAYRWFHAGLLPVPARQLATGTILVDPPTRDAGAVAAYARVSSADQRAGLDRQVAALGAHGRRIVVLDDGEVDDDLVRDMVEVLTWMCARLYGRRSARRRAQRAVAAAGEAST